MAASTTPGADPGADAARAEFDRVFSASVAVVGTVAWLVREQVDEADAWECCLSELARFTGEGRTLGGAAADVEGMKRVYLWGFQRNGFA